MSSYFSSELSTALSELLQSGQKARFDIERVKYVCHTSTIPLPTTVDEQSLLKNFEGELVEVTHSIKYQPGYDPGIDYRCCAKHCMYMGQNGNSESEILRANCPCGKVSFEEFEAGQEEPTLKFLQPLCFLQVIKELRYQFGYQDATECDSGDECCHNEEHFGSRSNRPKIDLADVMFCQNAQAITDASYSRPMRSRVNVSGWEAISTAEKMVEVLNQCYWFRKFSSKSTKKFMTYQHDRVGWKSFKQRMAHVLHTLNGQVVQKILLFPVEMEGYKELARLTNSLFEELLRDYFKPAEGEPTADTSVYLRIKQLRKKLKPAFTSMNIEVRLSVFDLILECPVKCSHARFWAGCFRRLKRRIMGLTEDYTLSPAWIYTMGGFCQTRNLGWLPEWVAEPARKQFRENLGREKTLVPKDELRLIFKLVQKRLYEEGIELKFLESKGRDMDPEFKEVIHSLRIPLKPSASNNSTVSQGGKVEDARQLLADAIKNRWSVPKRDFATGEIKGTIDYGPELRLEKPDYEDYIFWPSLQILLNYFIKNNRITGTVVDLPGSEVWELDLWRMQIVHISEPGKERNLTKTSSLVSWVLTVGSKICQMVLAFCQDHRAGLILSAQDWMHQKRVSSESFESFWMYDKSSRLRREDVVNGFQDWTESTDFICRLVGGTALQAFISYIGFPIWFGNLIMKTVLQDYTVTEVLKTTYEDGIPVREGYSGRVTEGFMMSMPLTKTILHLMHDVNVGLTHELLRRESVVIAPRPQEVRLDPELDRIGPISMLQ
uniref:RdRp n=1 Tax=Erysiphe necator associated narnavirus 4 TaxID=2695337 RepID=A0A7U3MEX9_9VIRU|nr:RdRp [Erysiphe necator associated narnavirus 4]